MPVVVGAVVMWESPQRFPRAGGRVGKRLSFSHAFHSASFPRPSGCGFKACRSMLFAPFKRAPEAEGFGSGFDDVGSIRDPVQ